MNLIQDIVHIDQQLFSYLNSLNNPTMDTVMEFISAKLSLLPFYIFLIGLVFYTFKKQSWLVIIAIALTVLLADQISVQCFKNVFERLRPCHFLPDTHVVNKHCGGQFGFVSSHATNVFAVASLFIGLFHNKYKWLTIILLIWASIVSYSRVYLGVHYPLDIVCGAILGSLIGAIVFKLYSLVNNKIYKC